ncbi:MAG: EFR1 family ferrodoxin [Staphylococcus sp.]|nr:EFR1 family ferrodoxin [Staphylococcus sp.]
MTIICFTATGNSLHVAKSLGPGRIISINAALAESFKDVADEDGIGIVCPVHYGALPEPVRDFFGRVGRGEVRIETPYFFGVLTYGEMAGCACGKFVSAAKGAGISPDYVRSIKMVDNNFTVVNVGKQIRDQKRKHIPEHLLEIASDISSARRSVEKPGVFGRIIDPFFSVGIVKNPGRRFRVEAGLCNGCGTCGSVCPKGNVDLKDGLPLWGDDCLLCTACYHNCPNGAVRFSGERSRDRFRNPGVSLKEIVELNKVSPRRNDSGAEG